MAQDFLKELISPGQRSNISFEESLLWKYSELARLSYKEGDIRGYEDLVVDEHDRIIGKKDGQEVWVGFRGSGTDSAHWLGKTGNLHATPNNDSVCRGFANAMQKFHDSLKAWCQGSRKIHLTGHSRGGAFATYGGWLLANDFEDAEVNVVVFGCPRVGTPTFAEKCRKRKNLRWAGFQHAGDHVGNLPPWGQHVHPPANPFTDFQAGSSPLLQRIPKVGNALNVMKNHSMESYHQSLKCNFILRTGAPDVDEIIRTITNRQQKAMLTIGVQAVKASEKQIQEQVRQAADELKELLSADRLKGVLSAALAEEFVIQMKGATRFLANMYATDLEGMKLNVHDLEKKLHDLVERLQHLPQDSTEMLKLLLEAFFKAGFVLAMCRMKLGDRPHDLKERFAGLGEDVKVHLWRLAHDLQNADDFFAALPSLVQVEAACAAHLDNREPLFVTDEIQDELLPHHIRPSKIQQDMRKLKKDLRKQVLPSEGPAGVAKLLSSKGLGANFVGLLEAILKDVACDSEDERLKRCLEEIEMLKQRMDDLLLPEVVLTGTANARKGPLLHAFLGQEVVSTTAVPADSFRILPTRFIPQEEGKTFQVELCGRGFRDQLGLFKDDTALKEMLEAKEVNTAEEVQETIKKINKRLRKFLDSRISAQKLSDEEKRVLSQDLCFDWSVDVKIPKCSHGALPVILVDLPGSTEDGLIGECIKTMVRGACSRASTSLLLLTPDMVIEYDRKGTDLVHRFFGGASDFSEYYIVITKVFGKKTADQWNPRVYQKAAQLKPEPLGIRFIDSYLLRAHVASRAGPLPERFPSVEVDASGEENRMCEAEKQRCQIIFEGVENKHMKEEDMKKFTGTDIEKDLKEELDEFPETTGFTSELCSFDVLGPSLKRMQRCIEGGVDEIHQLVLRGEAEVHACLNLLCNLDVEFMEPLKEKAWLKIQGEIERMAAFDFPGHCHEAAEEFYYSYNKAYGDILRQHLAEQLGWTGESGIPDFVLESLSQKSDIPLVSKQFAAVMATLGVAGAGALSGASGGSLAQAFVSLGSYACAYAGLCKLAIAETPDQRLASLKECAYLSLSRLNDSVKNWLQPKLEGQLTMLVEKNSGLPHLEKKLQQYLKVCDDLQEIQKVVKDLYQPPNAIA